MSSMLKISASDDLLTRFQKLQLTTSKKGGSDEKTEARDRYQIYVISGKEVVVESADPCTDMNDSKVHDAFITALKSTGSSRFGVVDYRGKIFFVAYQPDSSNIRDKMKYSSIKDGFKAQLTGVHKDIQANDDSDLAIENFDSKIKSI